MAKAESCSKLYVQYTVRTVYVQYILSCFWHCYPLKSEKANMNATGKQSFYVIIILWQKKGLVRNTRIRRNSPKFTITKTTHRKVIHNLSYSNAVDIPGFSQVSACFQKRALFYSSQGQIGPSGSPLCFEKLFFFCQAFECCRQFFLERSLAVAVLTFWGDSRWIIF